MPKKQWGGTPKIAAKDKNAPGFANQAYGLIKWFREQAESGAPLFQVLDMFPIPIEIFAPEGTTVFINRAGLELTNIGDASLLIGKYNLIKDPVCNDKLGYRKEIQKAFNGKAVTCKDFHAPVEDMEERHITKGKPFEKATMDLNLYPVWKDDKLHFVVCVFFVRSLYFGRPDLVQAREYIDTHWQNEYDSLLVARSVNISVAQLYHLFKQHIGMTPGEYHKKVKVEHIKEKLADTSLSIKEVFAACGEDSQGRIAKVFKVMTGLSPTEYRKQIK